MTTILHIRLTRANGLKSWIKVDDIKWVDENLDDSCMVRHHTRTIHIRESAAEVMKRMTTIER